MPAADLIDGRAIASQIQGETARRIEVLKGRGVQPGLVFVRVGEDPASRVYVGMKEKMSAQLGIFSETRVLPESTTEADLLKTDWRDWVDSAGAAYEAFAREVDEVYVAGICAGGDPSTAGNRITIPDQPDGQ